MKHPRARCPDCASELTRRDFLQRATTAAVGAGVMSLAPSLPGAFAAPTRSSAAETAVQKLHETLTDAQRREICFPFDHPARTRINANWRVSKPTIHSDFYTSEQRGLMAEIFRGVTSADGHQRFLQQMEADDGGFDRYSVAIFGEPKSGEFEWELTGRHMTIRADGDCVAGAAFGGPIVYGHGEEEPKDNLFHYQTQQANEVFRALDADQARRALLQQAPQEAAVLLQGSQGRFPGIPVAELSADQQQLVEAVVKVLLAPYREEDVQEALSLLAQGGGLKSLHMAFYKQGDLHNDSEWDIWRIEGPTFVSHFRGAPHVHAYLNIGTTLRS